MLIEVLTFRLLPGADVDDFLEADRRVQHEFVPNLPGFIRRTTARGEQEGEWIVITLWESANDAHAAARLAPDDGAVAAFDRLIDAGTVALRRYTTLD